MNPELLRLAHDQAGRAGRLARDKGRPVLLSLSLPTAAPEDPLAFLDSGGADDEYAFLWQRPADGFALTAVGALTVAEAQGPVRFETVGAACDRIAKDSITAMADNVSRPGPLFVGGFAFAPAIGESSDWGAFPAGCMILPRCHVVQGGSWATLTVNVLVRADSAADEVVGEVVAEVARTEGRQPPGRAPLARGGREKSPIAQEATLTPDATQWRRAVVQTIADIRAGRLDKLVLARECRVRCDEEVDPHRLLRRLRRAYPTCTSFLVRIPGAVFLGATPERLVALNDGEVRTAALAGSIARSQSKAKDRELGYKLLNDTKERREHALVVTAIEEALAPLCSRLDVAVEPDLLRLENVQHLVTPISGRLSRSSGILDLVARLHPSPAVGGYPRAVALQALREREDIERGWYAGPVGWMDARGNGDFAVAVRSALVRGTSMTLCAGAGIVAGSDPDAELAEVGLKMQPILSALTGEGKTTAIEMNTQRLAS